jgi:hypothetical protein
MKEEAYHLTPRAILKDDATYKELQRYMLLLKDVWKLGKDSTVAVVLEEGQLYFRELCVASPAKKSKKKK